MTLWNKTNTPPSWFNRKTKRNLILTSIGWVRRQVKGSRRINEIIVPFNNSANNAGRPVITDLWHSVSTLSVNTTVNTWMSFSQPISSTSALKITVANTAGGNTIVARANTSVYGTNKLLFRWKPAVTGTYKVQAQTIANATATASNVRSTNTGNTVCLRVITGTVSNTGGSLIVS